MSVWKTENLGPESRKAHERRARTGFFKKYCGGIVLDIGYRGYEEIDVVPVLPDAIGIDLNYPGYDGRRLPFDDQSVDTVYNSHTLEHIDDPISAIREWFRVLRDGGYLIIAVPHQFLYEKRAAPPSRWNLDHKRFYTPAKLLHEVECALDPNTYRIRHLLDDDESFDYGIPPEIHSGGGYQIELVLEKIPQPTWKLEGSDDGKPLALHKDDLEKAIQAHDSEMLAFVLDTFTVIQETLTHVASENAGFHSERQLEIGTVLKTARKALDEPNSSNQASPLISKQLEYLQEALTKYEYFAAMTNRRIGTVTNELAKFIAEHQNKTK